jgi:hypothetical protein
VAAVAHADTTDDQFIAALASQGITGDRTRVAESRGGVK